MPYLIKLQVIDQETGSVPLTAELLADPERVKSPALQSVNLEGVAEFLMEQVYRSGQRPID